MRLVYELRAVKYIRMFMISESLESKENGLALAMFIVVVDGAGENLRDLKSANSSSLIRTVFMTVQQLHGLV